MSKKSAESLMEKRKQILNRLADHRRWYDIKNKDGDVAEIRIYDEIGWFGVTAEDFVAELDEISAPEVVVAINCPGGDVFDGIAIYNALRAHPAKVTTRVDSLAASAASVIVQAGESRIMLSASQMMIHEAWGLAIGNADDMREMAEMLDRQSENLAGIYASRGSEDREHYRSLMKAETWFSDEESVEEGLADEVMDPSSKETAASAALAKKTLNDEITEAMGVVSSTLQSAERVVALRSEKGKSLSKVNESGLDELDRDLGQLHQEVRALLAKVPDDERVSDDELANLKAQIEALSL